MRIRPILSVLGFLLVIVSLAMLTALFFSFHYDEDFRPLLFSGLITFAVGILLMRSFRRVEPEEGLGIREGFAIVTFGWVIAPVFGCLPFILSGAIPSFTDAYFEALSGFTTAGASILRDVEAMPKGELYWRCLTQWLGGLGIIVMALAILPLLGVGGMQLFKAEVAGPTKDKLTPRVAETARLLWGVYVLVTAAEVMMLMVGGVSFYDALCHSFTTIATGGFSTKNASIASFNSAYVDGVVTLFMFVGATNFALHFSALKGGVKGYFRDNEWMFFTVSFLVAVAIMTLVVAPSSYEGDYPAAFRYVAFNLMSVMSTTGYATADFALWAPMAQAALLFLMFPGGCAGSTSGGMKSIRVLLLLKTAMNELKKLIHPKAVVPMRYNGRVVDQEVLMTIAGFIILFLVTFSTATIILTLTGLDIVSSMSGVVACMSTVGPGLGAVGPMANYADLSDLAKWTLSVCMLVGRLELFTVFVLFSKSFWKS
ncbi:MAG: TrkH family potassium uptake protein [Ignavibacteriales bacterium]|nr:TrkH family potassium uptake protein [Ignavibacteriales bacterium]